MTAKHPIYCPHQYVWADCDECTKPDAPVTMTGPELLAIRQSLGIGPIAMARLLDTPYDTYMRWENGKNRITGAVAIAIRSLTDL